MLLAESEYRHVGDRYRPFKGCCSGLFFISIGMALNLGVLYTHLLWVAVSVAVLVAVKMLVLYAGPSLWPARSSERMQFAGVLSGGGSSRLSSFPLPASQRFVSTRPDGAAAGGGNVVDDDDAPLLMKGIDKLLSRRLNPADDTGEAPWVEDDKPQVIIVVWSLVRSLVAC
ncbi:hypothetical protein MJ585_25850 [Klebsiella pneumoniae]|nr:hypothetical protein MJ585_25850 [Klebsiella pneumoniae]